MDINFKVKDSHAIIHGHKSLSNKEGSRWDAWLSLERKNRIDISGEPGNCNRRNQMARGWRERVLERDDWNQGSILGKGRNLEQWNLLGWPSLRLIVTGDTEPSIMRTLVLVMRNQTTLLNGKISSGYFGRPNQPQKLLLTICPASIMYRHKGGTDFMEVYT